MKRVRIIARLDIKGPNLIKGIHLEGLRIVGDPQEYALKYYLSGIDELIYIDSVASLYGRNNLSEIVHYTVNNVFIPITAGGGVRSVEDVITLLRSGADKVAVNTAATQNPKLITDISRRFGSQCMVLSIEAKRVGKEKWEVYIENGRERTGLDVLEWAQRGEELGAGEILLTSIDQEGTRKGMDLALIDAIASKVSIPVIASGGVGDVSHVVDAVQKGNADAVAIAGALHYNLLTLPDIRKAAHENNFIVRRWLNG